MNPPDVVTLPLPDAAARTRVVADLETNLLVEAGAGSGKTTELVARMVALVASGAARIEEIAAVTFTRKAAGELRERFQTRLEKEIRHGRAAPGGEPEALERLVAALEDIDRAFIGTIHSFCAGLLRERPLEVGVDPGFEELPVEERQAARRRFWESFLERLARDSDPLLEDLSRAGLRPARLERLFECVVENPDVEFPAPAGEAPSTSEVESIRAELDAIVDTGWELMPERQPDPEWDSLQKKLRTLHFTRDVTGWREPAEFFDAVGELCKRGPRGHSIVQKRWRSAAHAKALCARADAFGVGDTPARRLVARWLAHRYALAVRLARSAAAEFTDHRLRTGRLDFQDLLALTGRLLRASPDARRQFGRRYRRLLVDEFQDTDPLQAEIILLLASEPEPDGARERTDAASDLATEGWRSAIPRPGALFVVGDPKQSIYRFRRADIQLYGQVKERFATFGAVVELTTNFRSRPAIGDLVNDVFAGPGFFPVDATPEQAAFAPLGTRPPAHEVPREGVFVYDIAPSAANKAMAAEDDAGRVATWIRDRIDDRSREPGDFLILTRRRGPLAIYARALEAHSIPVQVTGAGVGIEEEIRELEVLLECMIDPTNPVKVVSALVGLFFGLDYEQLVRHRLEGGAFDVMHPRERGDPAVLDALHALRAWWSVSISEPADVFISSLVDELGLLPYAAAGDLGTLRAGALAYALDAVRASALAGEASLPGALAALRAALELSEAEAPLEPGRTDAVRLMNLHQAKGLEARVVVLADPSSSSQRRPDIHMVRRADGSAVGYLSVVEPQAGPRTDKVQAAPEGWDEKEQTELRFQAAEEVRLTYVAVTRAREELVVARWPAKRGSAWAALETWLERNAVVLPLEPRAPTPRERLALSREEAERATARAAERLRDMAAPTFRHVSVTEVAKRGDPGQRSESGEGASVTRPSFRGFSWGSAVHGALAASAAGASEEGLRATCRDLLVEHGRPLDDHGEPTELAELVELVRVVGTSPLWARALAADRRLVEVPFSMPGIPQHSGVEPTDSVGGKAAGRRGQLDLFAGRDPTGAHDAVEDAPPTAGSSPASESTAHILEGVIDLAFREADGWVIADYKTDVGTDPDFPARAASYRHQVELYAEAWEALTGEAVKERVLFYTARGMEERW